jgi:hypothetical protein
MPTSPESLEAIIVTNTSVHILWRFNTINECPYSGYSPNIEEFEPYED